MKNLIAFFVNNKLIVNIFIITIFIFGLRSCSQLKRETLPEVDFDILSITTVYPGAAPLDVELNVSKKIEEELNEVDGLDKFISTSSDNISSVIVWVDINEDEDEKKDIKEEIRKAVERAEAEFPEKVEKPLITEIKTDNIPIIRYQLSSATLSELELRKLARNLEDELENMDEISKVTKSAYRDAEIKVMGDLAKMRYRNISLQDIATAISQYNIRSGGGTLESLLTEKSIVTITEFQNLKEIEDVVIRSNFERMNVKIKDVAKVISDFEDRRFYARGNQKNGIVLSVFKKDREDIIRTVDKVKQQIQIFKQKMQKNYSLIPKKIQKGLKILKSISLLRPIGNNIEGAFSLIYGQNYELFGFNDITINTRRLLNISMTNAVIGFILVFITLMVFLEFKVALWTAFGIPMALMMVFIALGFMDFSINNISLFGLITVLGILVDDGIVAAENIHRKRELGIMGNQAAITGAYEVFYPILGTVLTTILAFLPLAFLSGIMGKFVFQLPIVIIVALAASLIEVFMGLPTHLAKEGKGHKKEIEARKWFQALLSGYKWILKRALKFRYLIVVIFIFMLFGALNLAKTMKFILFSNKETERIIMVLEAPSGTSLDEMLRRVSKVEKEVVKEIPYGKELDSMFTLVGSSQYSSTRGGGEGGNRANIQLSLVPFANRDRIAAEMVQSLRKRITKKMGFKKLLIQERKGGPPVGAPVELKVISNNDEIRKNFSSRVKSFLKTQKGVFAITDDSDDTKDEIRVKFNFREMYRLGVNPFIVAKTVRMAYKGESVSSIVKADEDIDIVVQLKKKYKKDIRFLKQLLIPTRYGKQIELSRIAKFPVSKSQAQILRYNNKRATTITAEVNYKLNTPANVMKLLIKRFLPEASRYPGLKLKVGGEAQSGADSIADAKTALLYAVFGIFIILILIFRSMTQPFFVLSVIPFGLIGVIVSFKFHSEPLGFFAMIGTIGLAGVVVNDSIVMVDFMNRLKQSVRNRPEMFSKVVIGASERLRPILLTTITTVMGLIPTVYGWGGSNAMLRPLTMAMAYGLVFGTTITLFLIPSFYLIDFDIKQIFRKKFEDVNQVEFTLKGAFYAGILSGLLTVLYMLTGFKSLGGAGFTLIIFGSFLFFMRFKKNIYAAWGLLILVTIPRILGIVIGILKGNPKAIVGLIPMALFGVFFWWAIKALKSYKLIKHEK